MDKVQLYYICDVEYEEAVELLCTSHGGTMLLAKFLLRRELDVIEKFQESSIHNILGS